MTKRCLMNHYFVTLTILTVVTIILVPLLQSVTFDTSDPNLGVALGWRGYADTDLNFSEFFSGDHTVMVRFMPQYPNAYPGPILAENGSGTYVIGQGEY